MGTQQLLRSLAKVQAEEAMLTRQENLLVQQGLLSEEKLPNQSEPSIDRRSLTIRSQKKVGPLENMDPQQSNPPNGVCPSVPSTSLQNGKLNPESMVRYQSDPHEADPHLQQSIPEDESPKRMQSGSTMNGLSMSDNHTLSSGSGN